MTDITPDTTSTTESQAENKQINPDVLQNISVTLSIEVGRALIKIRDLMRLTQGSVVELDRIAGEPLDLLINNTVVAQGEIVLVNSSGLLFILSKENVLWNSPSSPLFGRRHLPSNSLILSSGPVM
jgi:flagellar motor switch protein FliN/FliY